MKNKDKYNFSDITVRTSKTNVDNPISSKTIEAAICFLDILKQKGFNGLFIIHPDVVQGVLCLEFPGLDSIMDFYNDGFNFSYFKHGHLGNHIRFTSKNDKSEEGTERMLTDYDKCLEFVIQDHLDHQEKKQVATT